MNKGGIHNGRRSFVDNWNNTCDICTRYRCILFDKKANLLYPRWRNKKMTVYIVTIKLSKNNTHNPKKKLIGRCRYEENTVCDDCDGEHHSFLHQQSDTGRGIADGTVREHFEKKGYHVTRVEMI